MTDSLGTRIISALETPLERPTTIFLLISCSFICYYLNYKDIPVADVAFVYDKIVQKKEFWRGITSSFSHYSIFHLLFNMWALWSTSVIESEWGTISYLKITFILLILSMIFQILVYTILARVFDYQRHRYVYAVGYSCVVFGLMTVLYQPSGYKILGDIRISFTPFASLFLTQLIVPNASFVGHLSGIIGGFVLYFTGISWFITPIFIVVVLITLIIILWSLKKTTSFLSNTREWLSSLPGAQYLRRLFTGRTTVREGQIVRARTTTRRRRGDRNEPFELLDEEEDEYEDGFDDHDDDDVDPRSLELHQTPMSSEQPNNDDRYQSVGEVRVPLRSQQQQQQQSDNENNNIKNDNKNESTLV
eukprot:gb/GECH01013555.1/.p1 GENE.gb/GECH01013555.1/~~gb/GECH01013555.1/.p1  ORF type:complete len:362 (+),score=81.33 gb/GECH01013555.1/:1-1086(+)